MYDLFNSGDASEVDNVFSPDFIDHDPFPGISTGLQAMRDLVEMVAMAFSNRDHEILFAADLGGGVAVTNWRFTAVHTGEWLGMPPTGEPISYCGIDISTIRNDRVAELRHVEQIHHANVQISQTLRAQKAGRSS
ncbi:ester cyclase [Streptomyces sp. NPDC002659]|uniref:ester cyclase n=1 Tax=Streptomyces sp. NPDC002659 TaxID=3364656 RepID=UPI0036C37D5D